MALTATLVAAAATSWTDEGFPDCTCLYNKCVSEGGMDPTGKPGIWPYQCECEQWGGYGRGHGAHAGCNFCGVNSDDQVCNVCYHVASYYEQTTGKAICWPSSPSSCLRIDSGYEMEMLLSQQLKKLKI